VILYTSLLLILCSAQTSATAVLATPSDFAAGEGHISFKQETINGLECGIEQEKEWPHQETFVAKLRDVEAAAASIKPGEYGTRVLQTCVKRSRIHLLPIQKIDAEFRDKKANVSWSIKLLNRIETRNAMPSRQFYRYIMNYILGLSPKGTKQ
jgi:hypothetical protein